MLADRASFESGKYSASPVADLTPFFEIPTPTLVGLTSERERERDLIGSGGGAAIDTGRG